MSTRPVWATIFFAAVCIAFAATPASTQSMPSLSGTWKLNFDKSGDRIAGNGAAVPFPSEMVITQSATELSVERTSVRQAAFKAVYKLDGSRVTVSAPAGIMETAEARFDGTMLIIASRRSFSSPAGDTVIEFREAWNVTGNVLTVRKTVTQDGESDTETAVYDKT